MLINEQSLTPIQMRIIEVLEENGAMTRDDICQAFGFGKHKVIYTDSYIGRWVLKRRKNVVRRELEQYDKRSTIYDNLRKLEKRNIVEKFSYNNRERGRPLVYWQLRGDIS